MNELIRSSETLTQAFCCVDMVIDAVFASSEVEVKTNCSIFLAGPSPKDGDLFNSWRRTLMEQLQQNGDSDLESIQIIVPEPKSGHWNEVMSDNYTERDQTLWEHDKMKQCKVIAFWLPTFWSTENSGSYPANIGPATRFEFGFFLHHALQNTQQRLVVGSPNNADSLQWAQTLCNHYRIGWHFGNTTDRYLPESFCTALINAVKH